MLSFLPRALPVALLLLFSFGPGSGAHAQAGAAGETGGTWEIVQVFQGPVPWAKFGRACCDAGDVDGDGLSDIAITSPEHNDGLETNAGAVYVYAASDGRLLAMVSGPARRSFLGHWVESVGDLDGDGIGELLVSGPDAVINSQDETGAAWIVSPGAQSILREHPGDTGGDRFGESIAALGDLDGDGFGDYGVGSELGTGSGQPGAGYVRIFSGATGAEIARLEGTVAGENAGQVGSAGDLNGDGVPEILIGAPGADPSQALTDAGEVRILDGATLAVLNVLQGAVAGDRFGAAVGNAGDTSGDGVPDLMIGAPYAEAPNDPAELVDPGLVLILDGLSLGLRCDLKGNFHSAHLGADVGGGGDLNGDGLSDAVVGNEYARGPNGEWHLGGTWICSGRTRRLLASHLGPFEDAHMGRSRVLQDFNGDGRADFAACTERLLWGVDEVGGCFIYSFDPHLFSDRRELSDAAGGSVVFTLDFPVEEAGKGYLLLASASGMGPSWFGTLAVPLTWDNILGLSIAPGLPASFFTGASGVLDAAGDGSSVFTAAPGSTASFIGTTFHFAAVVLESSGLWSRSSAAVGLEILP